MQLNFRLWMAIRRLIRLVGAITTFLNVTIIALPLSAQESHHYKLIDELSQLNLTIGSGPEHKAREIFVKWMLAHGRSKVDVTELLKLCSKVDVQDQYNLFVASRDFLFPVAPIQFPERAYADFQPDETVLISENVLACLQTHFQDDKVFRESYCHYAIWNRLIDVSGIYASDKQRSDYFSVRHPVNTIDFQASFERIVDKANKLEIGNADQIGLRERRVLLALLLFCHLAGETELLDTYDRDWKCTEIVQFANSLSAKFRSLSFRFVADRNRITMKSNEWLSWFYGFVEVIFALGAYGLKNSPVNGLRWDAQTLVGDWPIAPLPNWK